MNGQAREGLRRATAWRFGYLLSQAGFSLTVFVGLAQILPTKAFAATAIAQGVLVIAQAVGDLGLSQAAVTALPARLATSSSPESLLRDAASAYGVATFAALAVACLTALSVPSEASAAVLLIAPAAAASVVVAGTDGLLRATGQFARPVALVTASRVGAFAALPAAAITQNANWTCAALSMGVLMGTLPALNQLRGFRRGGTPGAASGIWSAALPLAGAQVAILGAGRANTVLVSGLISLRAGAAFEVAWRVFQLGQYIAGGLATAAAPFIGHAVGAAEHVKLRSILSVLTWTLAVAGVAFGLAMALAGPALSQLAFGDVGEAAADVMLPFAVLSPFAFVGFLASTALAASDVDRRWVTISYGLGAALGISLVATLSKPYGLGGAAIGCAAGYGLAQVVLLGRFVIFVRRPAKGSATPAGSAVEPTR